MWRFFAGLVLAFGLTPSVQAVAGKPLSAYSRETWTTRNGLPHNQVNAVAQTPDGYLWFATWEGLVRYNGQDFRVLDPDNTPALKDHGIRQVSVGPNGRMVVATSRGGVSVREHGTWRHFGKTEGLPQNETMGAIDGGDGSIWIAHESEGLSQVNADGSIVLWNAGNGLPANRLYAVYRDRNDAVWAATAQGLARLQHGRLQTFGTLQGLPAGAVYAVLDAPDGGVFVGTHQGLFAVRNGKVRELSRTGEAVISLSLDEKGGLWLGTVNRGLQRYSAEGLETLDTGDGLPNNRVGSLFTDREGNIWAGTNAGLVRFSDMPFVTIDENRGLNDNYVRALAQLPDGSLMLGTSRGLNRYQGGKVSPVPGNPSLESEAVLSLASARDGGLWIGMYSTGLINWKNGVVRETAPPGSPLYGTQIRALLEDTDGSLWVGTSGGLYRKDGTTLKRYGREHGLPRDYVMSLHRARNGRIWVGTANGLGFIEHGRAGALDIRRFEDAEDVFGFSEDADGTLWIATDRGVLRLRDDRLAAVGARHGLPVSTVFQIVADSYGNFWLSSNRGVVYVTRAEMEAVADGRMPKLKSVRFSEADGMGSAQCNGAAGPAALRAKDGSIWVATAKGAAMVQPDDLSRHQVTPPPARVETLLVDDRHWPLSSPVRLPAGTRKLELFYVSLMFRSAGQIQYRYRLEGFDPDWVYRNSMRNVQFTNLPPGRYTFKVGASVRGGAWSDHGEGLSIEIEPKWHQHAWFYPLLSALLVLAVYAGFRLRVMQLKAREAFLSAEVEARTRDLHDKNSELESLNVRISAQSEAFARQARTDALTGLQNRRCLDEILQREFAAAVSDGRPFCFGLLDIDHFKRVNDAYSHDVGDQALCRVGDAMRHALGESFQGRWRGSDLCARWGGEEFALIFPDMDLQQAEAVCQSIRLAVSGIDCSAFAEGLVLTVSIGVTGREGLANHEKMVSKADANLYQAKHGGRNRVVAL